MSYKNHIIATAISGVIIGTFFGTLWDNWTMALSYMNLSLLIGIIFLLIKTDDVDDE